MSESYEDFFYILQITRVTKMSLRIIILFPQGKSSEDNSDSLLTGNLTFDPRIRLHCHYKHLIKITKLSQLHFAFHYQSKGFNLTKEDMLIKRRYAYLLQLSCCLKMSWCSAFASICGRPKNHI